MKKINFHKIKIKRSISDSEGVVRDISETFADIIYNNVNGIAAHALAHKIYEAEGEAEYTPEECRMIIEAAERHTFPFVIDAIRAVVE